MTGDDFARIAYLGLLGAAVASWFFLSNRQSISKTAQQAAVWGLIFIGAIAAYGLWDDVQNTVSPRQSVLDGDVISIPRSRDGHYALSLEINGTSVDFIVDTGASQMALSQNDAEILGFDTSQLRYLGRAETANGTVRTAPITLDRVQLGPIKDFNVRAVVIQGALEGSLLGMSYLNRFSRIEIANGRMVLTR